MAVINVSELSNDDLRKLIIAAMQEYQRRIEMPHVEHSKAVDDRPVVSIVEPADHQKEIILGCLKLLRNGKPVKAAERADYRAIAEQFESWMRYHRYPLDVRGPGAERWRAFGARL